MSRNAVRMRDIAEQVGVSVVTVSKALAGKDGVSAPLRQRINDTAVELGYRPANSDTLKQETSTIGILMAEHLIQPEHSFYWALYSNLIDCLKERGFYNMLELVRTQDEAAEIPVFAKEKRVDGLMVLGALPIPFMRRLQQSGLPIIQIDSHTEEVNSYSIIANSFWGTEEITRYLITKGHRKIGFIGDRWNHVHSSDCYYGYRKALDLYHLPFCDDWVLSDRDGMRFKTEFRLPREMPTAFVCNSDQGAYHFVRDLQRQGLRIPEDVSVVGFYGYVFSTMVQPLLTTYSINLREMAMCAVDAHLERLHTNVHRHDVCVVCGTVLERQSVLDMTDQAVNNQ